MPAYFLALALTLALTLPAAAAEAPEEGLDPVPLVAVDASDGALLEQILDAGLDVYEIGSDGEVLIIAQEFERDFFAEHSVEFEVVDPDVNRFPESPQGTVASATGRTDYRYLEDYLGEMETIVETYPEIARIETIGHGHEGHPMVAIEISSAPGAEDGRPQHIHTGLTHAREWPTGEYVMDLAWHLVEGYGSDDRVTDIVNSTRVWLIPVYNPDGFNHSRTTTPLWRKNRNPAGSVDLNRNYAHVWGGPGSSGNPNSNTYRGTGPFSEPETQAFRDFVLDKHPITVIHSHTQSGMWLYPWAHTGTPPPDPELAELAERAVQWSGWRDGQWSTTLYTASGESTDFNYGVFRSLSFLPEHGVGHGFHWPYLGVNTPGLATDALGDLEARLLNFSPPLAGQSGLLVDCGLALAASDCPPAVDGNIALVERGEGTYREKALNAAEAGAAGVAIYNNVWGHLTGHLGGAGVPIPVIGLPQFTGQQLLAAMAEGPVEGSLETVLAHSIADVWDINLPAYLLTIEAAAEFAARITGTVTDARTGAGVEATLGLEVERQATYFAGGSETYTHASAIETGSDGAYDWHVVPSQQPVMATPPYRFSIGAPNYYPHETDVELAGYQDVAEIDVALQPLARVLEPAGERRVQQGSTLPLRFQTYAPDGAASDADGLSVAILDASGTEIHRYVRGPGSGSIIDVAGDGAYLVNINTHALGLAVGDYEVAIEFTRDGADYAYTLTLKVTSGLAALATAA